MGSPSQKQKKDSIYKTALQKGGIIKIGLEEFNSSAYNSNGSSKEDFDDSKDTSPDKKKNRTNYPGSLESSPEKGGLDKGLKKSRFGR